MKIYALVVIAGVLVGCASQHAETNTKNMESANSKSTHRARLEIDTRFPPSPLPDRSIRPTRVLEVENDASLRLEGGTHAKMEGITCELSGVAGLRQLLLGSKSAVVFVPSNSNTAIPTPGEVFLVEEHLSGSGEPPQSFTRVAESALLSNWCAPDFRSPSHLSGRYRALAELAKTLPPRN
jgi:hypothetical protein